MNLSSRGSVEGKTTFGAKRARNLLEGWRNGGAKESPRSQKCGVGGQQNALCLRLTTSYSWSRNWVKFLLGQQSLWCMILEFSLVAGWIRLGAARLPRLVFEFHVTPGFGNGAVDNANQWELSMVKENRNINNNSN